ncbi:RDD family protein [Luteimonas sp. BDR2-5]|uniref:RDD family protein n=1 Tax=Proluteimonas luteida TaxID=2878685 RepID=UPI001E55185D|nr:RDD family protein [Luteimonas sp. BDR2-5]MCD9027348.1 RDD family protein [Luteimonas sp. BDR2-5]
MTDWYYADATNTRQGPVAATDLLRLRQTGRVNDDTLLWREGLSEWLPWRTLQDEFGPDADAAPTSDTWTLEATVPADAGAVLSTSTSQVAAADNGGWRPLTESAATAGGVASPYAPPAAPVARAAQVVHGGEIVYAGFWKRVAAYVIDSLIVGFAGMIIGGLVGGVIGGIAGASGAFDAGALIAIQIVANLLSILISAAYYAGFHASSMQATLGKMAVGIKVVRVDGSRISLARGIGRYFATILSTLILGIGFLMAGFTQRKQALHDIVCDTLVVDKWAFTANPELQQPGLGVVTWIVLGIAGGLFALLLAAIMLAIALGS